MQYRKFAGLDWQVSALGFGCMRLPARDGDENIDEAEAARMLRYAIDRGLNYVDTAYVYHQGNSERFLGRALGEGYRDRVRLATKLPCWLVKKIGDCDRILDEQLERLQTDCVDFYLLHSLNKDNWRKVRDLDVLRWAEGAAGDGRLRYLGFSFHDDYEIFREIVDAYDWTLCQIQYNYMDVENQAGARGLRYAAAKGLAVAIMEPLLGGKLVHPPERIQRLWDQASHRRTPADWALQWLWHQPEVSVVLSGMSGMEQVEGNLASAERSAIGSLAREELDLVAEVRRRYTEMTPVPCTGCGYCKPCPNGVDIPGNFNVYNQSAIYGQSERAHSEYGWMSKEARASACLQCRQCEERCPQKIPIGAWMQRIHTEMGAEDAGS